MKTTLLSLILVLLASACSPKTESNLADSEATTDSSQFVISALDVSSASIRKPGGSTQGLVIDVQFASQKAAEFHKFTQKHLNQKIQILVGTNVVAQPVIRAPIPGGQIQLTFGTQDEAQTVLQALTKQ
jgi:preprotein translocase subunit SecD